MELFIERGVRSVLFFATGGGGDVATAAVLALAARRQGLRSHVSSIVWERFVVDPVPGPIPLEEILGLRRVGDFSGLVDRGSRAFRGGREVVFQASRAAGALGEPVGVVDISRGVYGLRRGLEELLSYYGCEALVVVDVGGDIVATGYEEDLWSPLADMSGLSAAADLGGIVAVHSPGADGELSQEYVLKRISIVAGRGGYLGARGLTRRDLEDLRRLLEHIESEASRVSLLAAEGLYGYIEMRRGSRKTLVTPVNLVTFFLDPTAVIETGSVARELRGSRDIREARERLNRLGIPTELDIEEEVYDLIKRGAEVSGEVLTEIKRRLRERLRRGLVSKG